MRKIILVVTLCAVLILGSFSMCFASIMAGDTIIGSMQTFTFTDLSSSHWAYDSVNKMANYRLVNGYPDGSFRPGNTITYAEFIKMAATAFFDGSTLTNATSGHWAQTYYDFLVTNKVIDKNVIGANLLGQPIPRRDMAYILNGMSDKTVSTELYAYAESQLSDISGDSMKTSIVNCFAKGLLTGYPDGTFRPNGTLTRAEAATAIARAAHIVPVSMLVIPSSDEDDSDFPNPADYYDPAVDGDGTAEHPFIVETF